MPGKYTFKVNEDSLQQILSQSKEKLVILDFWAPWCNPCKTIGPMLERIVEQHAGKVILGKINVDEEQGIAAAFQIRSIPLVVMFKDNQPVEHFAGAIPESQIKALVEKHIGKTDDDKSPKPTDAAEKLLESGRWKDALDLLERISKKEPENTEAIIGMTRAMVGQGRHTQAQEYWKKSNKESETVNRLFGADDLWEQASALKPTEELKPTDAMDKTMLPRILATAAKYAREGRTEIALEMGFSALKLDRNFKDQFARRVLLAIYALVGEKREIVREYRNKMATLLY